MIKKLIEIELISFGFLPLLLVMEILADEEEYELCAVILGVLKEYSKKFNIKIPTKYNKDAIEEMKYSFMKYHNLSGDIAYNNTAFYAAEILSKIEFEILKISELSDFDKILYTCLHTEKRIKNQ